MKFLSALMTAASGSLGGITASHGKGGQYFRARTIGTNPQTARQNTVRAAMNSAAQRWIATVTAAQRLAWETYALNVAWTDVQGQSRNLTGQQHYMRSNSLRIAVGLDPVDAGPVEFNLGPFTPASFESAAAAGTLAVTFDDTDDWAGEVGSALVVYQGVEYSPSRNTYNGSYQFAGMVSGAVVPPASPKVIGPTRATTAALNIATRYRITRADGRLSAAIIDIDTVAA